VSETTATATALEPLDGSFVVDPIHSSLSFSVPAMGVSTFRNAFDTFSARLDVFADGAHIEGHVELTSLLLREPEQFRAHLLSGEFFSAEDHPTARFESNDVTLHDDGTVEVSGELELRGIAHRVHAEGRWAQPFADPRGHRRTHLTLVATVNRHDFGMNWQMEMPTGEDGLGDEVTVTAELALVATV
jgi:polyisoprenoid-binding protein YceI